MDLKITTCRNENDYKALAESLAARAATDPEVAKSVGEIIANVRANGDAALVDYAKKFDCPDFTRDLIETPYIEMQEAVAEIPDEDLEIIEEVVDNISTFHERQQENSWWTQGRDGTLLGQMVKPVDTAGLYVPGGAGGETPLVSSLIMTAVPALVAGVERIVVCTPPTRDGKVNPYILATAELIGVDQVFRLGSAWAVAAMAYGTDSVPACDVIAGPGNIYVAAAKHQVSGDVGIDMIAGPSEILILADETSNPRWLAADMLSQAEHDPLAAAILVTDNVKTASLAKEALEEQLAALPRQDIAANSLNKFGKIVVVPDMDQALVLANILAPEHLELAVADPMTMLAGVRNAGAVFLGHMSPEPVGDYFAGPNHVLPTTRTARFSSALSVRHFLKRISVISCTPEFTTDNAQKIARLARLEGLEAHARSVEIRLNDKK